MKKMTVKDAGEAIKNMRVELYLKIKEEVAEYTIENIKKYISVTSTDFSNITDEQIEALSVLLRENVVTQVVSIDSHSYENTVYSGKSNHIFIDYVEGDEYSCDIGHYRIVLMKEPIEFTASY